MMSFTTRLLAAAVLLPVAFGAAAAPRAELWQRWTAHDEMNKVAIDHGDWDAFVRAHVSSSNDGINRLDYARVSAGDKVRLAAYIAHMQGIAISKFPRAQQRAYWINLYNALTVKTVLDHYPVKSITDIGISPGFFARGPWGAKLLKIEGQEVSLNDIEHRILRPVWNDPRTHYSVNCASLGCPNLAPMAYTASNMEAMLDAGARAYVNHPRGAHMQDGELSVSSIYVWFKSDFGGDDAGVIAHLKKYAVPELAAQLATASRIGDDHYDWNLNSHP